MQLYPDKLTDCQDADVPVDYYCSHAFQSIPGSLKVIFIRYLWSPVKH